MSEFQIIVIAFIGTVATARLTRLLVADTYPPSVWVRMKWDALTHDNGWAKLVHCHWCASPYFAALVFGSGYLFSWPTWWYIIVSWLTASYVAAMIVERDEIVE